MIKSFVSQGFTNWLRQTEGKLELRLPQDRQGHFPTQLFERYQRSEKALVSALAEMYVQGVSTRKVKAITEELCGHTFSAATISSIKQEFGRKFGEVCQTAFRGGLSVSNCGCLYEKVREDGVIRSQAVEIAIGINEEGRRQILAVELANQESRTSWKEMLLELKSRGLRGVEIVVSDDHPGLKRAITVEGFKVAPWTGLLQHGLKRLL